jgi:hypothetical protein
MAHRDTASKVKARRVEEYKIRNYLYYKLRVEVFFYNLADEIVHFAVSIFHRDYILSNTVAKKIVPSYWLVRELLHMGLVLTAGGQKKSLLKFDS